MSQPKLRQPSASKPNSLLRPNLNELVCSAGQARPQRRCATDPVAHCQPERVARPFLRGPQPKPITAAKRRGWFKTHRQREALTQCRSVGDPELHAPAKISPIQTSGGQWPERNRSSHSGVGRQRASGPLGNCNALLRRFVVRNSMLSSAQKLASTPCVFVNWPYSKLGRNGRNATRALIQAWPGRRGCGAEAVIRSPASYAASRSSAASRGSAGARHPACCFALIAQPLRVKDCLARAARQQHCALPGRALFASR